MDLADIKRKAEAARELVVEVAGRSFTLRLPTPHEIEVEAIRSRLHEGDTDPAQLSIMRRRLLERGLVSWAGVTCEHLAPGAGAEPAEAGREAFALLLDAEPELAAELDAQFVARLAERNAKRAEARKN